MHCFLVNVNRVAEVGIECAKELLHAGDCTSHEREVHDYLSQDGGINAVVSQICTVKDGAEETQADDCGGDDAGVGVSYATYIPRERGTCRIRQKNAPTTTALVFRGI